MAANPNLNTVVINTVTLRPTLNGFTSFYEGDEVIWTGTATAPHVLVTPRRYGFEITVQESNQSVYQELFTLAQSQYETNEIGEIRGVDVIDSVTPEANEISTTRRMVITDLKQNGSSMNGGSNNLIKGFTVRLIEIFRRIHF